MRRKVLAAWTTDRAIEFVFGECGTAARRIDPPACRGYPPVPLPQERHMASSGTAALAPRAGTGGIAADRLRSLVERIERLEEERKALGADIRDVYMEAKSAGFDVKVMRQLIRLRRQEPQAVEEQETLLDLYRRALGM